MLRKAADRVQDKHEHDYSDSLSNCECTDYQTVMYSSVRSTSAVLRRCIYVCVHQAYMSLKIEMFYVSYLMLNNHIRSLLLTTIE